MADKKISALTASSTPLAGTEVLPIVQSGATVKVAVSDLTAGRAMSATSIALNGAASALTPVFIRNGAFSCSPFGADKQMATFGSYNDNLTNGGVTISALLADVPLEVGRFKNDGNYVPSAAAKGVNFTANTPAAGMTSQLLNAYEEGTWTPADSSGAGLVFTSVAGHYTKIGRCVTASFTVTYPVTASVNNARISLPFTSVTGDGNTGFYTTLTNSSQTFSGITVGTFLQFYDNTLTSKTNVNFSSFIIRGVAVYYV